MTTVMESDISNVTMRERMVHFRLMTFQWFPYLTPYVYSLVLVERPGIGTMAVDKQGRCYYDPAFVATLTLEQGGYTVIHECWHLVLRHCHRSKDIVGENPTPRQRGRLNVAYDCVVWELLEPIAQHAPVIRGGSIVTFPMLQAKYPKLKRNMLPSVIYSIMLEQDEAEEKLVESQREQERKEREEGAKQQTRQDNDEEEFDPEEEDQEDEDKGPETDLKPEDWQPDGEESGVEESDDSQCEDGDEEDGESESEDQEGDDGTGSGDAEGGEGDGPHDKWEDLNPVGGGSCADGQPRDYEEPPNDNWDSFIEDQLLDQVEKQVEAHERQHVHGRGTVPGCLKEAISAKLRPQPNPWDKLRAACGLAAANPRGRPDFTYQRPNRRQAAMPSGLILKGQRKYSPKAVVILDSSGSMTPECKRKCLNVVAQGLKAVGDFRVIVGDTMVRVDERFTSMPSNFEFKGGGGTCMVTLIRYAEEKYHPDLIVLGTDTGTGWPDKPTKAQLIVAATQDGYVPGWATRVRIPDEGRAE